METKTICAALAAISVAVALPSWAADRTINADYTLTADETVDGVLTVESGVTVDLNGHRLTVKGLPVRAPSRPPANCPTLLRPSAASGWTPQTSPRSRRTQADKC